MTTAPRWLVSIVDRLRGDYKDGNWLRSERVAQELIEDGYAPTNWPELAPNDLVLYQNDVTRPNRLVLSKSGDGYSIRVDTPLFDTRVAPMLTRSDLIDIAVKIIRATR
jgi:hypothetical protein